MSQYPPVGETWIFDIGPAQIEHHYVSDREMRYRILSGEFAGVTGAAAIGVKPLGGRTFLVWWQEDNQTTVTHWEDFDAGVFESFTTLPDLTFLHFSGTMEPVPSPMRSASLPII